MKDQFYFWGEIYQSSSPISIFVNYENRTLLMRKGMTHVFVPYKTIPRLDEMKQIADRQKEWIEPDYIQLMHNYFRFLRSNGTRIDVHNELSLIFWEYQRKCNVDMSHWVNKYHACEDDFKSWYEIIPPDMRHEVRKHYRMHITKYLPYEK